MATKTGPKKGTPEKFWRKQMALQQQSGLSQRAFCLQRGLVPGTFAWWKNQLVNRRNERRRAGPKFLPVRVVARPATVGGFDVQLRSGRRIQVPCPFDADSLRELVTILEQEQAAC